MAAPLHVIALPWYARGNYSALLKLFSDPTSGRRLTTDG